MSNCLPPMSDGRLLTRVLPTRSDAPVDEAYRAYMVQNADKIIEHNQRSACLACCDCLVTYGGAGAQPQIAPPYLYTSTEDTARPMGYQASDMKALYLSSEELNARLATPVWTQDQLLAGHLPNFN